MERDLENMVDVAELQYEAPLNNHNVAKAKAENVANALRVALYSHKYNNKLSNLFFPYIFQSS